MRAIRKLYAVALCVVAVLAAVPASQALADPPTIQTMHITFTREAPGLTQRCGFTVIRHRDLTIRYHYFMRDGNLVREVDIYQDNGYFSANGITVNYSEAGPNLVTYYPDGSVLYAGTGLFYNYRGTGFRFAGRTWTLVDADGNVVDEGFNGIDQGSLDDLCAALTP